jgi:Carboxypeptidase regulatory-like domain
VEAIASLRGVHVPKHRRNRPSRVFSVVWVLAMVAAATFATSLGSGTARADNHEPSPEESQPEESQPEETEGPIACPGAGVGGPLPPGTQSITGTVTDGTNPVPDVQVYLTSTAGGQHNTFTTATGEYLFQSLGNGTYFVSIYDGNAVFANGFHSGGGVVVPDKADATPVVLGGTGATGIDAVLAPETYGSISGQVTTSDGAPFGGVLVSVRGAFFPLVGCDETDGSGAYQINNLRSGVYTAVAERSGYPRAHFGSQVTVPPSATGIDIQFPEVHTLSGVVLDAGLNPIDNISVTACETTTNQCGFGSSGGGTGSFDVPGLVAGSYRIQYSDSSGLNAYRSGYYGGDGVWVATQAEAIAVGVPGGSIELRVVPAPTVSGTITAPLASEGNVLVSLCDGDETNCFAAYTDTNGGYSIGIPVSGTYTARVSVFDGSYPSGGYITAGGSVDPVAGAARSIVVADTNIGLIDATLPDGGRIGVTHLSGGSPVPFGFVVLCADEVTCVDGINGDENGQGTSSALFAGTYYVLAYNTDFSATYWYVDGAIGSSDFADAAPVVVVAGAVTSITVDIPAPGAPTDAGDDVAPVTVSPDDGSGNTPVEITFSDVEVSGMTTVTVDVSGSPVPSGFQLGLPALYYDISTTAGVVAPITICISYAGVSFVDEDGLRLFHHEGEPPAWQDITTSLDPVNDRVCGVTSSLSPFVLAERSMVFTGFFQPVDTLGLNRAKAGAGIPVKFSLGADFGLGIFADGYPFVSQIACPGTTVDTIEQTVSVGTSHLVYDPAANQYVYLFKTLKSWAGTCRQLTMVFTDGTTRTVDFQLVK